MESLPRDMQFPVEAVPVVIQKCGAKNLDVVSWIRLALRIVVVAC